MPPALRFVYLLLGLKRPQHPFKIASWRSWVALGAFLAVVWCFLLLLWCRGRWQPKKCLRERFGVPFWWIWDPVGSSKASKNYRKLHKTEYQKSLTTTLILFWASVPLSLKWPRLSHVSMDRRTARVFSFSFSFSFLVSFSFSLIFHFKNRSKIHLEFTSNWFPFVFIAFGSV